MSIITICLSLIGQSRQRLASVKAISLVKPIFTSSVRVVAQTLATQVINYKKKAASTTKATRTIDASNTDIFEGVIDMPAEPAVSAEAIDLVSAPQSTALSGNVFKISSGKATYLLTKSKKFQ